MTALLELREVRKSYPLPGGLLFGGAAVHAVDGVSFTIATGETFGLVGESGCGKSSLSRLIIRLAKVDSGEIIFKGRNIEALSGRALRTVQRDIAMVFQNPFGSLNPRQRVADILMAPLEIHGIGTPAERRAKVGPLLDAVRLPSTAADKYPHEFSGGQRQRIAIARALALNPSLVICDEAVSALDVSVQAQILNLLKDLQAEYSLTYLFISHDLSVVEHISDRVAVMQTGRIVEMGPVEQVFRAPSDPYTRSLLAAIPKIPVRRRRHLERA